MPISEELKYELGKNKRELRIYEPAYNLLKQEA